MVVLVKCPEGIFLSNIKVKPPASFEKNSDGWYELSDNGKVTFTLLKTGDDRHQIVEMAEKSENNRAYIVFIRGRERHPVKLEKGRTITTNVFGAQFFYPGRKK